MVEKIETKPFMDITDVRKTFLTGTYKITIRVDKEGLRQLLRINENWEWNKLS